MKYKYSDSIITNEIILNLFKYARISSELDGSEDHQFRGFENIVKGNETIELEIEEELDKKDDNVAISGSDQ